ncbi:oxygen sensor histidine kinase NreB [bacterium BMS3Abin03]|nr:oxygen sensor histidine kinase NreB [bacterium BMS3Abin03]
MNKKALEVLTKFDILFSQLWDISVDGMRLTDGNGIIVMVNDAYCKIVELEKDKMIGEPFSIVYHSKEQERVLNTYRRDVGNNEIKTHFERENTLWNGKKKWFGFSNSFLDLTGEGKYTLSIIKDITERKKAELELIESEKKFRMLFNNANDAVFVTQLTEGKTYGDFVEVNEIACNRLGYSKEEFLKLSPSAIVYPPFINDFNKYTQKLLEDSHVIYELTHMAKDKRLIPVEISSHLFTYEGLPMVLSIARDITVRKKTEEKLRRTGFRLRNLATHLQSIREEERTTIAREIHDELGQVLTVLKIQISLLANKLRDDQEELKDKIKSISDMIDGTVEKVQGITSKLRPDILDELGLIPAIEWQAQEFKKVTGINYSLTLLRDEVNLDNEKSTAIFRIFQEALTNIMRHSSATLVNISILKRERNLVLKIADNGIGINSKQEKDPKSLGLIGMKERAMIFGGEVTVEGIPGKGTEVTVEMPLGDN